MELKETSKPVLLWDTRNFEWRFPIFSTALFMLVIHIVLMGIIYILIVGFHFDITVYVGGITGYIAFVALSQTLLPLITGVINRWLKVQSAQYEAKRKLRYQARKTLDTYKNDGEYKFGESETRALSGSIFLCVYLGVKMTEILSILTATAEAKDFPGYLELHVEHMGDCDCYKLKVL